jgi:hypothetical protein
MQAHFCHAATICAWNGHEFDHDYGIGRCEACGRWVITRAEYERAPPRVAMAIERQGEAQSSDSNWWELECAGDSR